MDITKTIQDLYVEKEKLERVITALEDLQRTDHSMPMPLSQLAGKRRGRKSMNAKEREEVSERMKRYWAGRRQKEGGQMRSLK